MNYGTIKKTDIANGDGVRVSLFVSGCENHCPGCFNPETWAYEYGEVFDLDTMSELIDALSPEYISGLSVLGGEPLDPHNRETVTFICDTTKVIYPDKSIWIYTGYNFEDVKDLEIMKYIDVLVDGRFILAEKDISLQFRGSRNQRIINVPETLRSGSITLWRSKYEKVRTQ